jgi:hypothetical protein
MSPIHRVASRTTHTVTVNSLIESNKQTNTRTERCVEVMRCHAKEIQTKTLSAWLGLSYLFNFAFPYNPSTSLRHGRNQPLTTNQGYQKRDGRHLPTHEDARRGERQQDYYRLPYRESQGIPQVEPAPRRGQYIKLHQRLL